MKIIEPSYEILTPIKGDELQLIEIAGRTCYKSEDKITEDSAQKFVKMLIDRGHEAMLEHCCSKFEEDTLIENLAEEYKLYLKELAAA